ncbi:MAG: hypothetical protein ABG776_14825 [Cyanobacteria bacterium J06555_13]
MPDGPTSAELRGQVVRARARAMQRQQCTNAALGSTVLASWLNEGGPAIDLLGDAAKRFALSARHCHRLLRVARSIADLAESEAIEPAHMAEALSLRVNLQGKN